MLCFPWNLFHTPLLLSYCSTPPLLVVIESIVLEGEESEKSLNMYNRLESQEHSLCVLHADC